MVCMHAHSHTLWCRARQTGCAAGTPLTAPLPEAIRAQCALRPSPGQDSSTASRTHQTQSKTAVMSCARP